MAIDRVTTEDTSMQEKSSSMPPLSRGKSLRLDALLLLIAMIWGGNFLVVQKTVLASGPFTYLTFCFAIGTLLLALVFRKRLAHITRAELGMGAVLGLLIFIGYAFQTVGLQYTTTSKAGFITGLYVPLVPLFALIFLRQKPTRGALVGVVLSAVGLGLLSITNTFDLSIGRGELLILGCAFAFAMQIIFISKFVVHADAINLAIVQLGLTSVLSFVSMPLAGEAFRMQPAWVWIAIVCMGVIDVAFTFAVMNWAQQFVSSTRATLVYAMEPVWAGIVGFLAGQALSMPAWVGCGFIFLGMIAGSMPFASLKRRFALLKRKPSHLTKHDQRSH